MKQIPSLSDAEIDRFEDKIYRHENGCWYWTGAKKQPPGLPYGFFGILGKNYLAHRVAYQLWVGELIEGLEVDHTCDHPPCVNPGHLRQITKKENLLKSSGITAVNARKTTCPKGHEYSGSNLMINSEGRRVCRECSREASRRWKLKVGYH